MEVRVIYDRDADGYLAGTMLWLPSRKDAERLHPNARVIEAVDESEEHAE